MAEKQAYYTKARKECNERYLQKQDEIKIRVPKGKKDEYRAAAEACGKSLNKFIVDCIEKELGV